MEEKMKYQEMIDRLSKVIDESIIYLSSLKEDNDKGEFDENYPEYHQEYIDCVDDTIECMAKVIESMKVLRRCKEEYGSKQFTLYHVVYSEKGHRTVNDSLFEMKVIAVAMAGYLNSDLPKNTKGAYLVEKIIVCEQEQTYISVTSLRGDDVFYVVNEITVKVD